MSVHSHGSDAYVGYGGVFTIIIFVFIFMNYLKTIKLIYSRINFNLEASLYQQFQLHYEKDLKCIREGLQFSGWKWWKGWMGVEGMGEGRSV